MPDLSAILKMLEEEFEIMVKLFNDDTWKFYKFGQGGPYKRTLTKLQEKSNKYDQVISDFFGFSKETASFKKLVVLCISAVDSPKERYDKIDTFRRQIKLMRNTI